jgi:predicted nucleotidyltransferase
MISLITDNLDAIRALCRQYGIRRLDLFGSAATGAFDPDTSDLDFVVDLGNILPVRISGTLTSS